MSSNAPKQREIDECPYAEFCSAHEENSNEHYKQKGYWVIVIRLVVIEQKTLLFPNILLWLVFFVKTAILQPEFQKYFTWEFPEE